MKLWLLEPAEHLQGRPRTENPWRDGYNTVQGFVIRAETESRAREIAQARGQEEIAGGYDWQAPGKPRIPAVAAWLDV